MSHAPLQLPGDPAPIQFKRSHYWLLVANFIVTSAAIGGVVIGLLTTSTCHCP